MPFMRGRASQEGVIFNIQRFCVHDGPGIRTTVFMKGCPLDCHWCSNPEGKNRFPELMTQDLNCLKCGECAASCPQAAITIGESGRRIDRDTCDRCMMCVDACPNKGIECVGRKVSVAEIVEQLKKDALFYRNSEGGITISGGEPLSQWRFVSELLAECRASGFHTAIETTGHAKPDIFDKVLGLVDLVMYDIKQMDPLAHKRVTGVNNRLILDNARMAAGRVRTWLRYPVIPGYNDAEDNIRELAEFARSLRIEKISLLPYHEWGKLKYEKLGTVFRCEGVPKADDERLQHIKKSLESYGGEVSIGA